MKVYELLADNLNRRDFFAKQGSAYRDIEDGIEKFVKDRFPSGSGFDSGTKIDLEKSTGEKLVFTTSFHHMDDNGSYCGWSDHTVTTRPSFVTGFSMKISGPNTRDIKDYIGDTFHCIFSAEVEKGIFRLEKF